jgi:hypothetical protein
MRNEGVKNKRAWMLFGGFKRGRGDVEGLAVADVQLDLV